MVVLQERSNLPARPWDRRFSNKYAARSLFRMGIVHVQEVPTLPLFFDTGAKPAHCIKPSRIVAPRNNDWQTKFTGFCNWMGQSSNLFSYTWYKTEPEERCPITGHSMPGHKSICNCSRYNPRKTLTIPRPARDNPKTRPRQTPPLPVVAPRSETPGGKASSPTSVVSPTSPGSSRGQLPAPAVSRRGSVPSHASNGPSLRGPGSAGYPESRPQPGPHIHLRRRLGFRQQPQRRFRHLPDLRLLHRLVEPYMLNRRADGHPAVAARDQ